MLKKFKVIINNQVDISEAIIDISIDTKLFDSAGSCSMQCIKLPIELPDGCMMDIYQDGKHIFYGRLVNQSRTEADTMNLTFYDDIFYLQSTDANTFKNITADKIFQKLCSDFHIPSRVDTPAKYILPPKIQQDNSCYEIIKEAINLSFLNDKIDYVIIPMERELVFTDTSKLKKQIVLGTKSYCTGYTYTTSIEEDTYNVIKLVKEIASDGNNQKKRLEQYVVRDAHTMDMWGVRQYYEKVDEKVNKAQIRQKAENLLKVKNRVKKTLSLSVIAPEYLRAGYGVVLDVGIVPLNYYLITSCTYKISDTSILADLEVEIRDDIRQSNLFITGENKTES